LQLYSDIKARVEKSPAFYSTAATS